MARGRSPMCRSSTPSIVRRRSRGSLPRLHLLDEPNQGHLFIRRDLPLLRLVEYGRAGFASRLGRLGTAPAGGFCPPRPTFSINLESSASARELFIRFDAGHFCRKSLGDCLRYFILPRSQGSNCGSCVWCRGFVEHPEFATALVSLFEVASLG